MKDPVKNFPLCFKKVVYFWLCWVSIAACRLSLVAEWGLLCSRGAWASHCFGFLKLLQSTGSRHTHFSSSAQGLSTHDVGALGHVDLSSCDTGALVVAQEPKSTWASIVVACGLSYSTANGIFLDQRSNPCPLY